jgi:hypothetical protein
MTKYYIYNKENCNNLIRETYVEKDAKRYEKQGFIVRSRTKKIKKSS